MYFPFNSYRQIILKEQRKRIKELKKEIEKIRETRVPFSDEELELVREIMELENPNQCHI